MRKLPPLKAIHVFEAAARRGSFLKTAEELYITPSADIRYRPMLQSAGTVTEAFPAETIVVLCSPRLVSGPRGIRQAVGPRATRADPLRGELLFVARLDARAPRRRAGSRARAALRPLFHVDQRCGRRPGRVPRERVARRPGTGQPPAGGAAGFEGTAAPVSQPELRAVAVATSQDATSFATGCSRS